MSENKVAENKVAKKNTIEVNSYMLGLGIFAVAVVFSLIGFYGGYESYLVFNPPPPPEPTIAEKALAMIHWPWF